MKERKKRNISLLTAVFIVLMLMPVMVIPVIAAESATLEFVSGSSDSGSGYTWDGSSNTLTLSGLSYETSAATGLRVPDGTKIVIYGTNRITSTFSGNDISRGIHSVGSVTFSGTGSLTVTAGTSKVLDDGSMSCGIHAEGPIVINSGIINANGGSAAGINNGSGSAGISTLHPITIKGGTITANGGDVDILASNIPGYATSSAGIETMSSITIEGGVVYANGGKAINSVSPIGAYSYGITAWGASSIKGGEVYADGGTSIDDNGDNAKGIFINHDFFISGDAEVTATGRNGITVGAGNDVGGNLTMSGNAIVNAEGYDYVYAITVVYDFFISGGTVTARSERGEPFPHDTAIYAQNFYLSVPNYWYRQNSYPTPGGDWKKVNTATDGTHFSVWGYQFIEITTSNPGEDVPAASTPDSWAQTEVNAALSAGLVPDSIANGGWQNATSRLDAADAVVQLIEKASGKTMAQLASERGWNLNTGGFSDCNSQAVTFLKHAGVTTGVGDNKYDPDGEYNRAQVVTMIGRAAEVFFGVTAQGANPFTDVPDWAAPYVAYAAANGIAQGVGGGLFDPYGVLQNQHTAVFGYRTFIVWTD